MTHSFSKREEVGAVTNKVAIDQLSVSQLTLSTSLARNFRVSLEMKLHISTNETIIGFVSESFRMHKLG